jgi:hypothetical protein
MNRKTRNNFREKKKQMANPKEKRNKSNKKKFKENIIFYQTYEK